MSKHMEKFEEVKKFVIAEAIKNDGEINMGYKQIAKATGLQNISTSRNYILKMISQGILSVEQAPKRGTKDAVYRLLTDSDHNNHKKDQEAKEKDDMIRIIPFQGVELVVRKSEIGIVISQADLALATLEDKSILEKIIRANPELFKKNIIVLDSETFLNRRGVLLYLTKLNTNKILESKRQTLIQFNEIVLDAMTEKMAVGKVILHGKEKVEIFTNIANLIDVDVDQITEVFQSIEQEFNSILAGFNMDIKVAKQETEQAIKKVSRVSSLLESEKHRRELCISEVQTLKTQLLERGVN